MRSPAECLTARTALWTKRPAAVSIISESDNCAITSMLPRENKRRVRPATSSPVFSLRSSHISGRDSFQAGNSPKMTVLNTQKNRVTPITRASGAAL